MSNQVELPTSSTYRVLSYGLTRIDVYADDEIEEIELEDDTLTKVGLFRFTSQKVSCAHRSELRK